MKNFCSFDCVGHSILLQKFFHDIRGKALELIISYLSDRKQRVCLMQHGNEYFSNISDIKKGLPQGSMLVPFSIYYLYELVS